jgi:hypothetical protein
MAVDMSFLVADGDYYAPLDAVDPGPRYSAGPLPAGWLKRETGIWTHWAPEAAVLADTGWKVHVSSSLANAQAVLAVVSAVSAVCAESGVPFKHLTGRRTFRLLHSKHGARVQSGKFCALYPPTQDCALLMLRRLTAELSESVDRTCSPTAGSATASASPTDTARSAGDCGSTPTATRCTP